MLESDYPYTSGAKINDSYTWPWHCRYSPFKAIKVKVTDFENRGFSRSIVMTALSKQPVSVAIAANNKYIHSYLSGVIDANDCFELKPGTGV